MIATFPNSLVFLGHLKAALRAVCVDDTREHLCKIRLEIENGVARFIATNGHWLWVSEEGYQEIAGRDEKGKPVRGTSSALVHIRRHDVVTILKALDKAKRAGSMPLELDTTARSVRQGSSAAVHFVPCDETFPPYEQVLPQRVLTKAGPITLDPLYVADIMAAFEDVSAGLLGKDTDGKPLRCGVCFELSGSELDPVVVTSDRSTALAVFMPRRHDGKRQGGSFLERFRRAPGEPPPKAVVAPEATETPDTAGAA